MGKVSTVIIFRTDSYDNTKCIRELPYRGKSYWVANKGDLPRLKKFKKYFEETQPGHKLSLNEVSIEDIKHGVCVNYNEANNYVLGNTDVIPKKENFNRVKHKIGWVKSNMVGMGYSKYEIESLGGLYYTPDPSFHLILK